MTDVRLGFSQMNRELSSEGWGGVWRIVVFEICGGEGLEFGAVSVIVGQLGFGVGWGFWVGVSRKLEFIGGVGVGGIYYEHWRENFWFFGVLGLANFGLISKLTLFNKNAKHSKFDPDNNGRSLDDIYRHLPIPIYQPQ